MLIFCSDAVLKPKIHLNVTSPQCGLCIICLLFCGVADINSREPSILRRREIIASKQKQILMTIQ